MNLREVRAAVDETTVGKRLPSAFYAHVSAVSLLPEVLQKIVALAYCELPPQVQNQVDRATLVKWALKRQRISFLFYPDFDKDPHPRLRQAITVCVAEGHECYKIRSYNWRKNPPVLHRKETFVSEDYPNREIFAKLTEAEEAEGLLGNVRIGMKKGWIAALREKGLRVQGHELVRSEDA